MGGQIWFFMVLLAVALSAGTNALVSRFWGEGSRERLSKLPDNLSSLLLLVSARHRRLAGKPTIAAHAGASPEVEPTRLGLPEIRPARANALHRTLGNQLNFPG